MEGGDKDKKVPKLTEDAVLVHSSKLPGYETEVKGYDWSQGVDFEKLLESYKSSGFQATNYGLAVEEITRMVI
jgi:deoxyhypusine synthase